MPGGTLPLIGNNTFCQTVYASITPAASVTGGSATTSTYTIKGLRIGDGTIFLPQAALPVDLSADAVWVSASETLSISWSNPSSGSSSASPSAIASLVIVIRASNSDAGISNLPQNV